MSDIFDMLKDSFEPKTNTGDKTMLIEKRSLLTNRITIRDMDVTKKQMDNWMGGMLIQDAMPHLSPEDREWMMTGTTPDEYEWEEEQ